MDSFLGVHFGDRLDQLEARFPAGARETSPYGAPSYKLQKVSSGAVDYKDVIYEFDEKAGMQLVIAHFTPSSAAAAYQELQNTLGPPTSTGSINVSDISAVDATWQLGNSVSVNFNGAFNRLSLIGPSGTPLMKDIRLRDLAVPEVGSMPLPAGPLTTEIDQFTSFVR